MSLVYGAWRAHAGSTPRRGPQRLLGAAVVVALCGVTLACDPYGPGRYPPPREARRPAAEASASFREAFIRRQLGRAAGITSYRAEYRGMSDGRPFEVRVSHRAPAEYRIEFGSLGEILLLGKLHYQWVKLRQRRIVRYRLEPLVRFLAMLQDKVLAVLVSPAGGPAGGAPARLGIQPRFTIRARERDVYYALHFDGGARPPHWVALLRRATGITLSVQGKHRVITFGLRELRFDTELGLLVGETRSRFGGREANRWALHRLQRSPRFPRGYFEGADLQGFAVVERPLPPKQRERLVRAALRRFVARCVRQLAQRWGAVAPAQRATIRAALGSYYLGVFKSWFDELFTRSTLVTLRSPNACRDINASFAGAGLLRALQRVPDSRNKARKMAVAFSLVLAEKVQGLFRKALEPQLRSTLRQVRDLLAGQPQTRPADRQAILKLYRDAITRAIETPHYRAHAPRLVPIIMGCLSQVLPAPRP